MSAERLTAGGVVVEWDDKTRLMHIAYGAEARPTVADARAMQAWLDERIDRERPFLALADVRHADASTFAWRYAWASWAYVRHRQIRAAVIHGEHLGIRIIRAFARGTRVEIRDFASEVEARAWLFESASEA